MDMESVQKQNNDLQKRNTELVMLNRLAAEAVRSAYGHLLNVDPPLPHKCEIARRALERGHIRAAMTDLETILAVRIA